MRGQSATKPSSAAMKPPSAAMKLSSAAMKLSSAAMKPPSAAKTKLLLGGYFSSFRIKKEREGTRKSSV